MIKYLILLSALFAIQPAFAYFSSNNYTPYFNRYPNISSQSSYSSQSTYASPNSRNYNRPYRNYHPHRHAYYPPTCRHCDYYHPQYNRIPTGNLNALERYALKKNYTRESDISRLERLENLAFGATQVGDLNTRYSNVENAILSRPQNNYKRSVIGSIADFFTGQMTGFTPAIDNGFDNNMFSNTPAYTNSRAEHYSNGIFGGGWGIQNQSFGQGSGVRILD